MSEKSCKKEKARARNAENAAKAANIWAIKPIFVKSITIVPGLVTKTSL